MDCKCRARAVAPERVRRLLLREAGGREQSDRPFFAEAALAAEAPADRLPCAYKPCAILFFALLNVCGARGFLFFGHRSLATQ